MLLFSQRFLLKLNSVNFVNIHIYYPNLQGNIPTNAAYGVFTSQLVRYSKINLGIVDFKKDVQLLIVKLLKQGFNKDRLLHTYKKYAANYIYLWARFGVDITFPNFINDIFFEELI